MYDKPLADANHELFAQACVRLNNATAAYREVYGYNEANQPRWIWTEACRLTNHVHVGRRIEWLRAQILELSQLSVVSMMHDLHDIATANPAEICSVVVGSCRHCHGEGFKYQWRDMAEFVDACEAVARANEGVRPSHQKPAPSDAGGFGFDVHRHPNPMCPECMGVGVQTLRIADTSTLSEKARKLYTGQMDKYGRPVLHDQLAARDQLHKLLGAYKVNSDGQALGATGWGKGEKNDGSAAVDPAQAYLGLVHGGRKAAG